MRKKPDTLILTTGAKQLDFALRLLRERHSIAFSLDTPFMRTNIIGNYLHLWYSGDCREGELYYTYFKQAMEMDIDYPHHQIVTLDDLYTLDENRINTEL